MVQIWHQEAQLPPWERLPYQWRACSHQQYWNRRTQQDQFWPNIREQVQQGTPPPQRLADNNDPLPDLEE